MLIFIINDDFVLVFKIVQIFKVCFDLWLNIGSSYSLTLRLLQQTQSSLSCSGWLSLSLNIRIFRPLSCNFTVLDLSWAFRVARNILVRNLRFFKKLRIVTRLLLRWRIWKVHNASLNQSPLVVEWISQRVYWITWFID